MLVPRLSRHSDGSDTFPASLFSSASGSVYSMSSVFSSFSTARTLSSSLSVNHYSPPADEPHINPAAQAHKISATSLTNPDMQDVFVSIVKGRKTWKKMSGGEAVWPPELEAALLEGLGKYKPVDSRETRLLGRFPMRNIFISDWIFERTGRRRSAKQVGSRLQQLRDTYVGKTSMRFLAPKPCSSDAQPNLLLMAQGYAHNDNWSQQSYTSATVPGRSHSRMYESGSSRSAETILDGTSAAVQSLLFRGVDAGGTARRQIMSNTDNVVDSLMALEGVRTVVLIDVVRRHDESFVAGSASCQREETAEEARYYAQGYNVTRASLHARRLDEIDPTTTFISHLQSSPTECYNDFTVYEDALPIFAECTPMQSTPHIFGSQSVERETSHVLCQTSLVPGYWDTIVQSDNASRYSIVHKVFHINDYENSEDEERESKALFVAMYRFVYCGPPSLSASVSCRSTPPSSFYSSAQSHEDITPTPPHPHLSFTGASLNSDPGFFNDLSYDKSLAASNSSSQLSSTGRMTPATDYRLPNNVNNNGHIIAGWMADTTSMSRSNNDMPSINMENDWTYSYYGSMFAGQVDNSDARDVRQ